MWQKLCLDHTTGRVQYVKNCKAHSSLPSRRRIADTLKPRKNETTDEQETFASSEDFEEELFNIMWNLQPTKVQRCPFLRLWSGPPSRTLMCVSVTEIHCRRRNWVRSCLGSSVLFDRLSIYPPPTPQTLHKRKFMSMYITVTTSKHSTCYTFEYHSDNKRLASKLQAPRAYKI